MKETKKLILFSLLGGVIVALGSYLLVFLNVLDPYYNLDQVFNKFGLTYSYEFSTFGEVFRLWSTVAMLPITGQNLLASVFSLESLFPLLLFFGVCVILGYFLKVPNGLSASLLVFLWTMVISMVIAFFMPHTLPSLGLSPSDTNYLKGLADELILLTLLTPPNMLEGTIITLGSVILGGGLGGMIHRVTHSNGTSKKRTKKKTTKKKK
ncbi:MAG: hypothetical protein ACXABI_09200 [Candidatus Hodarchaeales archaeon]